MDDLIETWAFTRHEHDLADKVTPPANLDSLVKVLQKQKTDANDPWKAVDIEFANTIKHADTVFRTNYLINLVVVVVGVIFVGISVYSSVSSGVSSSSLTFAGLGVADFVALFFVRSQQNIEDTIVRLSEMEVIYKNYLSQKDLIDNQVWDFASNHEKTNLAYQDLVNYEKEYTQISEDVLGLMSKYPGASSPAQNPQTGNTPAKPNT